MFKDLLANPDVRRRLMKGVGGLSLGLLVLAMLYYPIGMAWVHVIDDDPNYMPPAVAEGESAVVAMAAGLIDREVNQHRWTANDPFFMPGAALDNMPNFQTGLIASLSRFAIEMTDHIGRTRGSSEVDPDLDKAAGLLKYAGNIWVFDFSTSIAPTATSDAQYRAARKRLLDYNRRLAEGKATFERRADNLQATLERITADLGSASAIIDRHLADGGFGLFDLTSDDIFYRGKGSIYGYYMLLSALGRDYENVIAEKQLDGAWAQMLDSLRQGAVLQPLVVLSGKADSQVVPSHLASQGFYLLRARTQVKEIANILLK